VSCNSVPAAGTPELFFCRGFDIDRVCVNAKYTRQIVPHVLDVWSELRTLRDNGCVDVVDAVSVFFQQRADMCGEDETVGTAVLGICVRKMFSDVTECCRTEQRIHDCMGQNVRIGMTEQSALVWNINTA